MTAVLHFLVIFEAAGLVGIPLAARAFGRLPGAGIAFARVLAWLVLAWVSWTLASLGVPNGTPLALACVVIVVVGAAYMHWRGGGVWPGSEPGFGRRLFIATEVLFVVTFAIAVLVNGYGADVAPPTEKPMDMMFINSTLASPDMPPEDPWLAGVSVNYYYLGHYMVGLAIRLAAIEPSAGYNMGLAVVFALMVTTAFAAAATLAEAGRRQGLAIRRPLAAGRGAWCCWR